MPTFRRKAEVAEELYPSPIWAIRALLEQEKLEGVTVDPACGDGRVVKELHAAGYPDSYGTDLNDWGFGRTGVDFLNWTVPVDNIITNPPYADPNNPKDSLATRFALQGYAMAKRKSAMLMRLAFLEGGARFDKLFYEFPPARIYVFSERLTMYRFNAVSAGSGTTAYAWFVWDRQNPGIGCSSNLLWIPPGTRERLSAP